MTQDLMKDRIFQFLTSLNEMEISIYVSDGIKSENQDAVKLIKYAGMLGAKMEMLLCMAIKTKNLQCICACIKNGADIHHINESGESYIHISTNDNNPIALKYFISKGLDVNKKNICGLRPSEIALAMDHYECYKILLENGAEPYCISDDNVKIHDIEIIMESYEPNNLVFDSLINIVVEKTDPMIKLNNDMFDMMKKSILTKHQFVEKVLLRFPNFVNTSHNGVTLLLLLIDEKEYDIVNKIINLKTTNLNPSGLRCPYLSLSLAHGSKNEKNIENINLLINKIPKTINKKCMDGRTPIDYLILGYKKWTTCESINMIKLLVDKSMNNNIINNRNKLNFRTLETAIQFSDHVLVDFLISIGINVNDKMIREYCFEPQLTNNDPLSFACQLNKTMIVKTFLDHNATINTHDNIPICLLVAIMHELPDTMNVLMSDHRIEKICKNETIKNKLLDFCLNNTSSKNITKHFIDDNKLNTIQINQDTVIYNKIERFYENQVYEYQEKKEIIIYTTYVLASYYKLITSKITKHVVHILISFYFDVVLLMGKHRDLYECCILSVCLNYTGLVSNNFVKCDDCIKAIIHTDDPEMTVHFIERLIAVANSDEMLAMNHKLAKICDILKNKRSVKYLSDDISEYSLYSENDTDYVRKVLEPLEKPNKVSHYDQMFQRLSGLNCIMSETTAYIVVRDNTPNNKSGDESKITSIIFNDGSYVPKRWFKFYQHNIGKENKIDPLHLFPFILDKKLKDVNCYQKCVSDNTNQYGNILLVSFLGILSHSDEIILGVYEYFIDATGMLFHRFFKPYDQIPEKLRKHLNVNTKQQVNAKYNLAKEIIKHF